MYTFSDFHMIKMYYKTQKMYKSNLYFIYLFHRQAAKVYKILYMQEDSDGYNTVSKLTNNNYNDI